MTLQDLGKTIREMRESKGLSIEEVAASVKVSSRILSAIEDGKESVLPHAVYAKGFIRAYGKVVGFEPDELNEILNELFPEEVMDNSPSEMLVPMGHQTSSGMGKRILVLLVLLLILGGIGYGGWFLVSSYGSTVVEYVKKPFSAVTSTDSQQETDLVNTNATQIITPQNESSQPSQSENGSEQGLAAPAASSDITPVADIVPAAEVAPVQAVPGNAHSLSVSAKQECWISFRSDAEKTKEYMTLEPGQSKSFEFKDKLELSVGNAGGITIVFDGVDQGVIGLHREVKNLVFP